MTHYGDSTTVTLPGGYVDQNGVRHREVELAMMTGADEYFLAGLDAQACAATLTTELLARCVRRVGSITAITPTLMRALLIGDRDYLLVKLRELAFGGRVECVLTCPQSACGEKMSISFDLSDLGYESKPLDSCYFTVRLPRAEDEEAEQAESVIEFRLPTGADQEALAGLFWQNPEAAAEELFTRCVRPDAAHAACAATSSAAARRVVEQAIQQLAPDVEIEIATVCPECGAHVETPLDFAMHFLSELKINLQGIEREVHFLAWHYHWSEHDILAMTRNKRRRYVALLQAEVDRLNQVW